MENLKNSMLEIEQFSEVLHKANDDFMVAHTALVDASRELSEKIVAFGYKLLDQRNQLVEQENLSLEEAVERVVDTAAGALSYLAHQVPRTTTDAIMVVLTKIDLISRIKLFFSISDNNAEMRELLHAVWDKAKARGN